VDDDPGDELIVGMHDVFVFDDPAHGFEPLYTDPVGSDVIGVAMGDFDAAPMDPRDEWVVSYTAGSGSARFQIYDGLTQQVDRAMTLNPNDGEGPFSLTRGFVTAANIDGAPGDEIAVFGNTSGNNWYLMLIDDANASYGWFNSFYDYFDDPGDVNLVGVDIDGDGRDEVLAQNWIYDGFETIPTSSSTAKVTDIYQRQTVLRQNVNLSTVQVRAGNVAPLGDNNERPTAEELVAYDLGGQLKIGGYGSTGVFGWTPIGGGVGNMSYGDVLAVANVDTDSEIVHYQGKHELLYGDPKLLVAMSAPPFYAGSNQDQNSSTPSAIRARTRPSATVTCCATVAASRPRARRASGRAAVPRRSRSAPTWGKAAARPTT
jgi:hypothetical protein